MDENATSFEGLDYGPLFPAAIPSKPPSKPGDYLSMPWWVQMAWTVVFTSMIVVAIGGNCIVMWIVVGESTQFYIVKSSISLLVYNDGFFFKRKYT